MYFLLCDMLGICIHLTNQCRRVFSAPGLLPEPTSLRHDDACQSTSLFVLLRSNASADSSQIPSLNSSYSCFAAHFFRWVDLACFKSIFYTSFGQTYLMSTFTCLLKNHGVPLWPFYVQTTGLTQNSTRRSSHLSPRLNLENLHHPRFFLFCVPFANPRPFCPSPSCHGRKKLLFHFKTINFQEER